MNSNISNVGFGIVDYSLYTRRFALTDGLHKNWMDVLAYTPVEYNFLETPAKNLIIPARQNQFIQENNFNHTQFEELSLNDYNFCS